MFDIQMVQKIKMPNISHRFLFALYTLMKIVGTGLFLGQLEFTIIFVKNHSFVHVFVSEVSNKLGVFLILFEKIFPIPRFFTYIQLNEYETDQYFLQNFQSTTMLIHAFGKICEREVVFVLN